MTIAPPSATPASGSDIKALYARGLDLLKAGKPDQALPLFGQIIDANPRLPEPLWQAARIFCDFDNFDRAMAHAEAAALLKPAEPTVWMTWADIVGLDGRKDSERVFLAALKSSGLTPALKLRLQDRFGARRMASKADAPGVPGAVIERVIRMLDAGDFKAAQAALAPMLKAHPTSALLTNMMGSVLGGLGQSGPALAAFQAASKLDPLYAEAFANAARELARMSRDDDALTAYRHAIARAPGMERSLYEYVVLLNKMVQPGRALPYAERLVAQHPKSVQGHIALGNTLTLMRDYVQAESALSKAVTLSRGTSAEALMLLAQAVSHLGRDDQALDFVDRALALKPDYMMAMNRKAMILQTLGRFDEADPLFRRALELAPMDGELWRGFVTGFKVKPDDPIIAQMEHRIQDQGLTDRARMGFDFALGKALEDVKRHDDAFTHIRRANDTVRKLYPYDMALRYAEVAAVQSSLRGFDWSGTAVPGASDAPVVFVTGMPRSGTTLVEQIIASHSRVTGAGELALFQTACQKLLMGAGSNPAILRALADVPMGDMAQAGHEFIRTLTDRFPGADVITDKSISTYMYIGLVRLILPQSRIIVVRRDPRDTLLSIYKNRFPEGTHLYAYDLRDLAHYYATFVEMVEFWRAEAPDAFTEVQYETLVANPETESRRLIAAAGLAWEDACLNFHQNTRKVDTLSVYQVRQPISGGSVKAWQRYEAELAPMIDVLRERGLLPD